jgi:phosphoribosylamine-glycine ligase
MSRASEIEAANRLEELSVDLKDIIIQLRNGTTAQPYALVYHFRTQVGHVVASLGSGYPGPLREESQPNR